MRGRRYRLPKAGWPAARRDQRRRPATTRVRREEPHQIVWNDSVPPFDEQDVRARQPDNSEGMNPMTDPLLSALRRIDAWTLIVFNPRLPSDRRRGVPRISPEPARRSAP